MKKVSDPLTILGFVFSFFAMVITLWLLFFKEPDSPLLEQAVYWFLIALIAAVIPYVKQLKWKDLELQLKEIADKVDSNRRYANEIFLIDSAGNLAVIYREKYKVWLPCGTRLELNEQPHEAVFRAIFEDLGLDRSEYDFWPERDYPEYDKVKVVPAPYQVQEEYRTHRGGVLAHYDFIYVCRTYKEKPTLKNDYKLKPKWVSIDELTTDIKERKLKTITFDDVVPIFKKILKEMGFDKIIDI